MSGVLRPKKVKKEEQFFAVNDFKLQMTLAAMSDKYSDQVRELIHKTYDDNHLAMIYRRIRNSGVYQKGSKSKVRRKIVEFPNAYVYDFINTVMTTLYGSDWQNNNRAWNHDLIKPWWVVEKL